MGKCCSESSLIFYANYPNSAINTLSVRKQATASIARLWDCDTGTIQTRNQLVDTSMLTSSPIRLTGDYSWAYGTSNVLPNRRKYSFQDSSIASFDTSYYSLELIFFPDNNPNMKWMYGLNSGNKLTFRVNVDTNDGKVTNENYLYFFSLCPLEEPFIFSSSSYIQINNIKNGRWFSGYSQDASVQSTILTTGKNGAESVTWYFNAYEIVFQKNVNLDGHQIFFTVPSPTASLNPTYAVSLQNTFFGWAKQRVRYDYYDNIRVTLQEWSPLLYNIQCNFSINSHTIYNFALSPQSTNFKNFNIQCPKGPYDTPPTSDGLMTLNTFTLKRDVTNQSALNNETANGFLIDSSLISYDWSVDGINFSNIYDDNLSTSSTGLKTILLKSYLKLGSVYQSIQVNIGTGAIYNTAGSRTTSGNTSFTKNYSLGTEDGSTLTSDGIIGFPYTSYIWGGQGIMSGKSYVTNYLFTHWEVTRYSEFGLQTANFLKLSDILKSVSIYSTNTMQITAIWEYTSRSVSVVNSFSKLALM